MDHDGIQKGLRDNEQNRGRPHHSAIFVNLARIEPNRAEYRGFGPPDSDVEELFEVVQEY
jgi:hypothetical protein